MSLSLGTWVKPGLGILLSLNIFLSACRELEAQRNPPPEEKKSDVRRIPVGDLGDVQWIHFYFNQYTESKKENLQVKWDFANQVVEFEGECHSERVIRPEEIQVFRNILWFVDLCELTSADPVDGLNQSSCMIAPTDFIKIPWSTGTTEVYDIPALYSESSGLIFCSDQSFLSLKKLVMGLRHPEDGICTESAP